MSGFKKIALINLAIISGFVLSGCREKEIEKKEVKIGVTLYSSDDVFIKSVGTEIEKRAVEISEETEEKVKVDILNGKEDIEVQKRQIDNFIEEKYDVVCINIVDRTKSAEIIDKCKSANIPVIFFNREIVDKDMERWDKVYYVGTEGNDAGKMQGELLIDKYKKDRGEVDKNNDGKIQYAILEGEEGHQDTILRSEYCIKELSENGLNIEKIDSENANWRRDEAKGIMKNWIDNYDNKIEVIFSNNDEMAIGAREAISEDNIKENKKYNPIIIGVDGTKEGINSVKNGEMLGTIISDTKILANEICNLAYKLYANENINIENNIIKVSYEKFYN
ncbi:MAG: galactose ABC transporter substrate-binding protein [Clostridium sp.]